GAHPVERLLARPVPARRPRRRHRDQAGVLEHRQVLGDGGLGEGERRPDLPGGQLPVPDQAEDLAPDRRAERPDDLVDVSHGCLSRAAPIGFGPSLIRCVANKGEGGWPGWTCGRWYTTSARRWPRTSRGSATPTGPPCRCARAGRCATSSPT